MVRLNGLNGHSGSCQAFSVQSSVKIGVLCTYTIGYISLFDDNEDLKSLNCDIFFKSARTG